MLAFVALAAILAVSTGVSAEERIVGGNVAPPGAYPHQVSLQWVGSNDHFCGGFILTNRTIVTAAQCVALLDSYVYQAMVGSTKLSSGGTRYLVESHIIHPDYDRVTRENDIALVFTIEDIVFSGNTVRPLELNYDVINTANLPVLFTGWGRLSSNGAVPDDLQVIGLQTFDRQTCEVLYSSIGQRVHLSNICTLTKLGEGACSGDSGSALMYNDRAIGVMNFLVPCATGYPDVYARISYFTPFIDENKI